MNFGRVEKIAGDVLYEGYILYPYRSAPVKNARRWNFGVLYPQAYSYAQGGTESFYMQTECLFEGDGRATLDVKVRFLHLLSREVCVPIAGGEMSFADYGEPPDCIADDQFRVVTSLEAGGRIYQTRQEAIEREVCLSGVNLDKLVAEGRQQKFAFPSKQETEFLREPCGRTNGALARRQNLIEGLFEVAAERAGKGLFKIAVRILNLTLLEDASHRSRDEALMRSLVSTHTILGVRDGGSGAFVSLHEPPEDFREAAASCRNVGTWPVMAGEEGTRDCVLSSPVVFCDYPQNAKERAAGALFDKTEMDKVLTLRVMTLRNTEKREVRGVDESARRILERTVRLPVEQSMKLHGAIRTVHPHKEDGLRDGGRRRWFE